MSKIKYALYSRNLDWMEKKDKERFLDLRSCLNRPGDFGGYIPEVQARILALVDEGLLEFLEPEGRKQYVMTAKGLAAYTEYALADLEHELKVTQQRIEDIGVLIFALEEGSLIG